MTYDVPAQVTWVATLTTASVRSYDLVKVIDLDIIPVNVTSDFEQPSESYNVSLADTIYKSKNPFYSITNSSLQSNQQTFSWRFSAYEGPLLSGTVMLAVNYINNNTAFDLSLSANSNSTNLSAAFSFEPYPLSGTSTTMKIFTIPAGIQNYPIALWVYPNENSSTKTFDCKLEIKNDVSTVITITGNEAIWVKPT